MGKIINAILERFKTKPKPATSAHAQYLKAFFDAAKTNANNRRRWNIADYQANYSNPYNDTDARRTIMNRARQTAGNNPYCKGMVLTMANDVISDVPRLQMLSDDDERNTRVEEAWRKWAEQIKLARKLRSMRYSQTVDGEAFAIIAKNPNANRLIKLDLQVIDPAIVTSPMNVEQDGFNIDGIDYDIYGNPTKYHVLKLEKNGYGTESRAINAADMIHVFRVDQAGQMRGISEIAAALEIFSILGSYILSVLDSAQTAAALTGIAKSQSTADDGAPMDDFYEWELERNQVMFLPAGWDFTQLKAEQPTTTFNEFVATVVNIAARAILIPYNVAAGNSSKFNFASGRLDFQAYHRMISIIRDEYEVDILDRIFNSWYDSYLIETGDSGAGVLDYHWRWKGFAQIDPKKSADADAVNLANGTTTLAELCGREGQDYNDVITQRIKERKKVYDLETENGLPHETNSRATTQPAETEDEESEVEKEAD